MGEPRLRMSHWSRRLDHCMIHVSSSFLSYGTSGGKFYYTLFTIIMNIESIYRHAFIKQINPLQNRIRVCMAGLVYTIPVLIDCNCITIFIQIMIVLCICLWLFGSYPFGGWSHSIFHLVLIFLPYYVLLATMNLKENQIHSQVTTNCFKNLLQLQ